MTCSFSLLKTWLFGGEHGNNLGRGSRGLWGAEFESRVVAQRGKRKREVFFFPLHTG
jgi:hypothetical protein